MRLQLLRLLNPLGPGLWQREIDLIHQPTLPEIKLEIVELHVDVSLRLFVSQKSELQQAVMQLICVAGLYPCLITNLRACLYADDTKSSRRRKVVRIVANSPCTPVLSFTVIQKCVRSGIYDLARQGRWADQGKALDFDITGNNFGQQTFQAINIHCLGQAITNGLIHQWVVGDFT